MATLRVPIGAADHISGPLHAPVKLVEYGDYQCPHCATAYPIVSTIRTQLGENLCFAFRHFPLSGVHPLAEPAAETAEFAGAHRRFWNMHNAIYQNWANLSFPLLLDLAQILSLDVIEFRDALSTGRFRAKVRADFIGGVRSGVNGTPTFFINGIRHDGSYAYQDMMSAIRQHIPLELKPT